jgi:DNA-binding NtrC family response regulator
MTRPERVLVVDDEAYVRESLSEVLQGEGYRVSVASDAGSALEALEHETIDVVVTDLRMPSGDGLALLAGASGRAVPVPVVVITGVGTVGEVVAAMKAGAFDLLQKPVDPEELCLVVARAVEHRGLVGEVRRLRSAVRDLAAGRRLVGGSQAMRGVRDLIAQVAPTEATVLLVGESGTGKELVAQAIHAASPRAAGPLVRVNCAAIPGELFESELFGHKKGAFTGALDDRVGRFEEAERGTLVLDEIGTLRPDVQAKLLRVLDAQEYQPVGESRSRVADARIVAVTNEDLARRVEQGTFRPDLLYRLNVFPIVVPPLREHMEDIPEIVASLLERARAALPGAAPGELPGGVLDVLGSYSWPGNVRELRNVIERAVIVAGDAPLDASLVRTILESTLAPGARLESGELHLRRNLDAREKELILKALARTGGRKREAAQLLGIDPRNFGYYARKHGMTEGA